MSSLSISSGSEGPKHDPYAFTEVEFTKSNGDTIVLHEGLSVWLTLNGKHQTPDSYIVNEYHKNGRDTSGLYKKLFENLSGLSVERAHKIWERRHRIPNKCPECNSRKIGEVAGYPGEYFTMCMDCNKVFDSRFNMSEIE